MSMVRGPFGVVRTRPSRSLDFRDAGQQLHREEIGFRLHHQVQEPSLVRVIHWLGLI